MVERLEQTYRKERGRLLQFIRSRIAGAEDAEDILQEVFIQAVGNLNAAQPIDNLVGWLYTAARNKIIDIYRSRKYRTVSLHGTEDEVSFEALLKDSGIDLEKDFMRSQVTEALIESLEELPENQRQVFIMQAVEGLTFREISDLTGTPLNTLIARKRYAVQFLGKRLADIKDVLEELK